MKKSKRRNKLSFRSKVLLSYAQGYRGGASAPPRPLEGLDPHHLLGNVQTRNPDEVLGLDGEHLARLARLTLGGREHGEVVVFGDLDAVHEVVHLGDALGGRDAEVVLALVFDDEGEHLPRTPSEGLNLATLALGDGLLDGGEVGEVNARAVDADSPLFEDTPLEVLGGLALGLEGEFDELPLLGGDSVEEGRGVLMEFLVVHSERHYAQGNEKHKSKVKLFYDFNQSNKVVRLA